MERIGISSVQSISIFTDEGFSPVSERLLYIALSLLCTMQAHSAKAEIVAIQVALIAVMSGLVTVATFLVRIPNPMGGYFNLGDAAVFAVALTFNPIIGGFAGGIGSAIADVIGFPLFAIPTLIIKGTEGFLAGLISNKRTALSDVVAVIVAGCVMIFGYFVVELFAFQWGWGGAMAELPGNIAQVVFGGLIGIPLAYVVRRRLPEILK